MKTILITGSTDGIGKLTARTLVELGHHVLVHGRNATKVEAVVNELAELPGEGKVEGFTADLSSLDAVEGLAKTIADRRGSLDVLINNAGVFATPDVRTADGLDVRFAVNTVAPYLLTRRLLPTMGPDARVVNLSSAAQAPVDLAAMAGDGQLSDMAAYSQSKLAITAWTAALAREIGTEGPMVVSVNPGSMLGTNMVHDAFGSKGNDVGIGADILVRAALSDEFDDASGRYFDNDAGRFGPPHADAADAGKADAIVHAIDAILAKHA